MDNKYNAVLELVKQCPLVGTDVYFNFIDQTNNDGNTTLATVPYGQLVKKYVDGDKLLKMQFEIRQVKPLAQDSNTTANAEEMQKVKEFLDWINEQGRRCNFPDFGEKCEVQAMRTPEGTEFPSMVGVNEQGALYAFPFEILYIERE
ncbi:MAG: hypothetical protein J6C82_04930 [Clostridia bacterium]|nr:hypothetical protein [Clostridia bacterium]